MKTSQMLKVIPIATLALLMSCSGNKSEEATETQNEKVKVKVETVSVPRKKPDSHSTDRSQRSRRNVSLHGLYFEKAACGFYRSAVPFYPDHYDLHVPPAHRSGDRKTSGK